MPRDFLATGGCFESNTYRVMVIDWLKKEGKNEQFRLILNHFRLATLKQFLDTILLL